MDLLNGKRIMNKSFLALLFLSLFLITPAMGQGVNCSYSLTVDNTTLNWSGSNLVKSINIRVTRGNRNRRCDNARIGITKGFSGNYNRRVYSWFNGLEYNVYKNNSTSNQLKELADINTNTDYIDATFSSGQTSTTTSFEIRVPYPNLGRTTVPQGSFIDFLRAEIASTQSPNRIVSEGFMVLINSNSEIAVSLVNTGGSFDQSSTSFLMDFATLFQGDAKGMDLIVKTNTDYTISISSQNGGRLKHVSANYFVPYIFKLDGGTRSLSGGSFSFSGNAPGGSNNERRYSVEISIGSVANKLAGEYQDTITITATSNN